MISSTVLLSLLLINCVIAKLDLAKQEKEVDKFRKGTYPNAVDKVIKQSIHLSEEVYDSVYEDMETVLKNEPDKYALLIKNFDQLIENILKILEKLKPNTEWGKLYETFVMKLVEAGQKKLKQVKATTEGKDVKHVSKQNYMEDVIEVTKTAKKRFEHVLSHNNDGIEESPDFIKTGKTMVHELAHIKTSHKIDKTLIDGLIVIIKKLYSFSENCYEKMKKH